MPLWRSMASTSVVLPWSTWAIIAMLRMGCVMRFVILLRAPDSLVRARSGRERRRWASLSSLCYRQRGPAAPPQSEVPANERGCKRDLAAPLQKSLIDLLYKSNKRTDILSPSPATSYLSRNSTQDKLGTESPLFVDCAGAGDWRRVRRLSGSG